MGAAVLAAVVAVVAAVVATVVTAVVAVVVAVTGAVTWVSFVGCAPGVQPESNSTTARSIAKFFILSPWG